MIPSSACGASPQQPLHNSQINNQQDNGRNARDGSHNVVNSGNVIQINVDHVQGEDVELDRLLSGYRDVSKYAVHSSSNSPPECYPNTRTPVCNEIGHWTDESGSEKSPLLWVYGPTGAGKSVIVKTIAASHDHIVVATFSFSTSPDRRVTTLVATLARQLAQKIPGTKPHIIAALKNNGSLLTSNIEEQFDHLIIQSLNQCAATLRSRPVMVIDGVDECIDEIMLARFLRVLVLSAGQGDRMPVRFIICSRPESRIRAIFGTTHRVDPTANRQELWSYSLLHSVRNLMRPSYHLKYDAYLWTSKQQRRGFTNFLQDLWELYRPISLASSTSNTCHELADTPDKIYPHPVISTIQISLCKEDIERYLTDAFNAIPRSGDDTDPWFKPSDISDLVEASHGQFLYASVIVKLISEPHFDPRDVFEMARCGSLPTPDLNELYKAILKRAQDSIRNEVHEGGPDYETELGFLMDSLAVLVFLKGNACFFTVPKSFPVIENLLGLESGQLNKKLCKMHSVLRIVPGESVQVHHRSFLEFLQSRERSGEYYISYSTALRRILVLMGRTGIRYNILQDNDNGRLYVQDMIVACRHNFFGRSRFPNVLHLLQYFVHLLMRQCLLLLIRAHVSFVFALSVPPVCQIIMRFFLGFFGTYILSLTIYTFFLNRSIIIPFFHPFLHPFFIATGGFLRPSRLLFILLVSVTVIWLAG